MRLADQFPDLLTAKIHKGDGHAKVALTARLLVGPSCSIVEAAEATTKIAPYNPVCHRETAAGGRCLRSNESTIKDWQQAGMGTEGTTPPDVTSKAIKSALLAVSP